MKSWGTFVVASLLLFSSSGCIQLAALIELDSSGSGKIFLRYLVSEQLENPEGASSLRVNGKEIVVDESEYTSDADAASNTNTNTNTNTNAEANANAAAPSLIDKIESDAAGLVEQLGEGVTFVGTKRISRGNGWRGIRAEYAFHDINTVTLPMVDKRIGQDESDAKEQNADSFLSPAERGPFRFRYEPGAVNRLVVYHELPELSKDQPASDPFAAAGLDLDEAPTVSVEVGSALGVTMAKAVMQGFRVTTLIKVDGEIIETNAVAQPKPNSVTVLDLNMTRFSKDKKFDQAVREEWSFERLVAERVPGVSALPADQEIRVTFR